MQLKKMIKVQMISKECEIVKSARQKSFIFVFICYSLSLNLFINRTTLCMILRKGPRATGGCQVIR